MSFTRLEITHGFSNQQDQLARAELFIFSNCRDPHNVVVSDKKNEIITIVPYIYRRKQRSGLVLLTMSCNRSRSMYETL